MEENAFQHRLLSKSKDPDVIHLKDRIGTLRAELSTRIYHPEQGKDFSAVWLEVRQAERDVRQRARAFKTDLEVSGANLDNLMDNLPTNSGLIEFRVFKPADIKKGGLGKPR